MLLTARTPLQGPWASLGFSKVRRVLDRATACIVNREGCREVLYLLNRTRVGGCSRRERKMGGRHDRLLFQVLFSCVATVLQPTCRLALLRVPCPCVVLG